MCGAHTSESNGSGAVSITLTRPSSSPGSTLKEAWRELITDPLEGSPALIEAINLAFAFFGTNP